MHLPGTELAIALLLWTVRGADVRLPSRRGFASDLGILSGSSKTVREDIRLNVLKCKLGFNRYV